MSLSLEDFLIKFRSDGYARVVQFLVCYVTIFRFMVLIEDEIDYVLAIALSAE